MKRAKHSKSEFLYLFYLMVMASKRVFEKGQLKIQFKFISKKGSSGNEEIRRPFLLYTMSFRRNLRFFYWKCQISDISIYKVSKTGLYISLGDIMIFLKIASTVRLVYPKQIKELYDRVSLNFYKRSRLLRGQKNHLVENNHATKNRDL